MDAISRMFTPQGVTATGAFGRGASYAVPSSTLPRGSPVGPLSIAPGSTTVSPPSDFGSPEFLKNVSAFSSAAAGIGGLAEGLGTARNLKAIRKQEGKALKRDSARAMSLARVNYAKAGVIADEGTPLDILSQAADDAELDQLWLKYRYRNYQTQANIFGATSATDGALKAGNTLLSKKGR